MNLLKDIIHIYTRDGIWNIKHFDEDIIKVLGDHEHPLPYDSDVMDDVVLKAVRQLHPGKDVSVVGVW